LANIRAKTKQSNFTQPAAIMCCTLNTGRLVLISL